MISVACPTCGRPALASLASPDTLACPACGHRGPMPGDARALLDEGRRTLFALQASERQLNASQLRSLDSASRLSMGHGCLTIAIGLVFLPFLLLGVYGAFHATSEGDIGSAMVALAVVGPPTLIFVGLSWFGRRQIRKPAESLRIACAAVPPARPGEPGGCHVCGGPVPVLATQAVTRCVYCGADNMLDAASLRLGAARHGVDVRHIASAVTSEARALGTVALGGYATALASVIVMPIAGFVGLMICFFIAMSIELPPTDQRFVLVEHGGRKCAAYLTDGVGNFGGKPPAGFPDTGGHGEQVTTSKMVGRTLEDGRRVVKAVSLPPKADALVLDRGLEIIPFRACFRN